MNRWKISLVNDLGELARIAERIDEFCEDRNLGPQIGYAVNLSVDEILTNTISYGYDDEEPHEIEIVVSMEGDAVVVVIVDDSTAFDLSQAPDADIESSVEERALGGARPVSRASDDGRRRVPAYGRAQRRDADQEDGGRSGGRRPRGRLRPQRCRCRPVGSPYDCS